MAKNTTAKTTAPVTAKSDKAPKATKPADKNTPAPAVKETAPVTREKKTGLRKPQVRILLALAGKKGANGLTRKEISELAPCDVAWLTTWVGSSNDEVRLANDAKEFPSLLTLKLVKATEEEGRGTVYFVTPAGIKASQQS